MTPTPRVVGTFTHADLINAVAFSQDGRRIATASEDKTVQVHRLDGTVPPVTFTAELFLSRVSFDAAGELAAASGRSSGIRSNFFAIVFDPATGRELWRVAPMTQGTARPSPVNIVFSPTGNVALAVERTAVRAFAPKTGGVPLWPFDAPAGTTLYCATFSPDGATIAVGIGGTDLSSGQTVLLDAASGNERRRFTHSGHVRQVAFSPDGGQLAFGADDGVGVLDLANGAMRSLPNPPAPHGGNLFEVIRLVFSPDRTLIGMVSVRLNGIMPLATILDADPLAKRFEDIGGVLAGFSPDSRWVMSTRVTPPDAFGLSMWDPETGTVMFSLPPDLPFNNVVLGPEALQVAVTNDNTATVFELPSLARLTMNHDGPVTSVEFNADGSQLLSACEDETARVFDTATGAEKGRIDHDGPVNGAKWLPGRAAFVTASDDHTARTLDLSTATQRSLLTDSGPINAVAVSSDGQRVATAGDSQTVRLIDPTTGQQGRRFTHDAVVRAVAFNPDGTRLATGCDDGSVRVFNTSSGAEVMNVSHNGAVPAVAFSADGTTLATGCADGSVQTFSMVSGAALGGRRYAAPINAVAFSPDGTRVVTAGDDGTARIVLVSSGAELGSFTHGGPVHAVAFNPAATLLCTASEDKTARVFDVASGAQRREFVHDAPVRALSIDAGGLVLATASDDKAARLFSLPATKATP